MFNLFLSPNGLKNNFNLSFPFRIKDRVSHPYNSRQTNVYYEGEKKTRFTEESRARDLCDS
jgi:hypothetical protein